MGTDRRTIPQVLDRIAAADAAGEAAAKAHSLRLFDPASTA